MVTRRGVLRVLGGTAVFAAATGLGLSQCNTMPAEAVAGWAGPGSEETEPRRRAIAWALLAANPHNYQSWMADLREADVATLYVDTHRLLPMTDPPGRQIMIGCGCFLETLVLAAAAEGQATEVTLLPEGFFDADMMARPFARVVFRPAERRDPDGLAGAITRRRSNKNAYDAERPLAADDEAALRVVLNDAGVPLTVAREAGQVAALRDIAKRAWRVEVDTDRTYRESAEAMRIGDAIAWRRDGLAMTGPMMWWLDRFGMMSVEAQMAPGSTVRDQARGMQDGLADSTPGFGWLKTATNTREMQLRAGRAYTRLNLAASARGVAMAPWSSVLQEFDEMAPVQKEFAAIAGEAAGEKVQMFFRLGYADPPGPTPRRPVDDIIRG